MFLSALVLGACAHQPDPEQTAREASEFHHQLATGHFVEDQIPGALIELVRALELDPKNADAHQLMGLVRIARREFPLALRHLKIATELDPKAHEGRNNLGTVHLAMCQWREAATLFEGLTQEPLYKTPWVSHNNLGWAYFNLGRRGEAIRQFRKSVFFNPGFCVAYNNLGMAYLEEGRLEDAEDQLRKALVADPTCDPAYAEPHLHLGRLFERRQEAEEACAELARCVAKAPPGEEQVGAGCGHSPVGLRCLKKARQLGCAD